jgi:hypothetical protein
MVAVTLGWSGGWFPQKRMAPGIFWGMTRQRASLRRVFQRAFPFVLQIGTIKKENNILYATRVLLTQGRP